MSVEALNLQLWIDRISGQVSEFNNRVYGAAELETAVSQGMPRIMPAAYWVPASDRASANQFDTGISQRVENRLSLIIAIRNVADATGSSSHQELRTIRKAAMNALLNWSPDGNVYDITEYQEGRLVRFQNGVLWWEDIYRTALYLSV